MRVATPGHVLTDLVRKQKSQEIPITEISRDLSPSLVGKSLSSDGARGDRDAVRNKHLVVQLCGQTTGGSQAQLLEL